MRPEMIILVGDFISERLSEKLPYEGFKPYFDTIGQILKDNEYRFLKEGTQWVVIPSVDDPGQTRMMPCTPLAEYFFSGVKASTSG